MANGNFIVQNGLQVGPLVINASTGDISTSGNLSVTGAGSINVTNIGVSQIAKNDSSISINDTGTGSAVVIAIDGATELTVDATGAKLPASNAFYINGVSVLNATTLGTGVTASSLTSVGTLGSLTVSGAGSLGSLSVTNAGTFGSLTVTNAGAFGSLSATGSGTLGSLTVSGAGSLGSLSVTGAVTIGGDLTVNGTTTTINATTLSVDDKNIELGSVATPTNVTADGGGITLKGATDKTFTWVGTTAAWTSSEDLNLLTGKVYEINGTTVLSATALGTGVTASSLTSVGTITSGIWNAGAVTSSGAITSAGAVTGTAFASTVATGTAPLTVNSTTTVTNLSADLWDGNHFATYLNQAVLTTSAPTFAGITVPSITKSGTSGTGDIGSSANYFGTVYGKATTAQYADLAENYQGDKYYTPGTVVMFGGDSEVTLASADTTAVAGVVSTNPAHLMNGALTGPNVVAVAFTGRVPCQVIGPVKKGDIMVSAGFGFAKVNNDPKVGTVIGKALQDFPVASKGVIEVVVGRF